MKKYSKALVNLAIALIILLLIIFALPKVLVFFMPFVIGWIIALIASPLVRFLEERLKLKRKASSAFVIIVVIALVVLVLYLVGAKLADEVVGMINSLPEMWAAAESDVASIGQNFSAIINRLPQDLKNSVVNVMSEVDTYVGDLLGQISSPTIAAVGNFAKRLPSIIIATIMALLSAYFFVADRAGINEWLRNHAPKSVLARYDMMRRSLVKSVGGYFKAQLKIEVWMYLLLVIGLSVLKVPYAALIAIVIAFLDFFPFFGTGTVMVPWAILKILSSDYKMAIGLLIIWGVGQLARQIIQPKIVGDSIGVPPIPTLFLLYIGYKFGGVIGMIVAVPLGLLVYTMYEEGAFDTTVDSMKILIYGINRFRALKEEDMPPEIVASEKKDMQAKK